MKIKLDEKLGFLGKSLLEATAGIVVIECKGRLSPSMILSRMGELAAMLRTRPNERELWIVEPGRIRIHERE